MSENRNVFALRALQAAPALLFVAVATLFSSLSPRFLEAQNFANIVNQAAHIGVIAIGMTFVLLIAGIDLSVGASMYVSAVIAGLYFQSASVFVVAPIMALIGLTFGAVNAFFIVRLRIAAFITTLATLFVGRGLALYLSSTKMVFAGESVSMSISESD